MKPETKDWLCFGQSPHPTEREARLCDGRCAGARVTDRRTARESTAELRAALRECVEALEGYHKTAMFIAYAQWTHEMHRADAALSRAKRLVKP